MNPAERMIPILPCRSIDDQIGLYESLGFEVTYRQKAPNVYASVQRGGIELHFFVMKGYDPTGSYSSCYVMVDDIDPVYADFRAGLKRALGRIPTRGIPRIVALKHMSYGVRQFLVTDPGGNIIRIGQPIDAKELETDAGHPRLEKAYDAASLLMDSKADPESAARVLDGALAVTADAPATLLARARILRADAALAVGDDALAASLLEEVAGMSINPDDRAALADELARADDMRRTLA